MIQQEELKTKTSTRIIIGLIAVAMIASTLALYFGIIVGYGANQMSAEEENEYQTLMSEYETALKLQEGKLSATYLPQLVAQRSQVKAFNAGSITELSTRDLKVGDGQELEEGDTDYASYYIGWCADETIFDSSFDDTNNPSMLLSPLSGTPNLIEGWLRGIVGMKLGGIREVTVPGQLAYGETREICGGTNAPLKFIILVFEEPEDIPVSDRLWELYQKKNPEQF